MQERLMGCLERAATLYPDKPALIDGDKTFTYKEFAARVAQLANGLKSRGIKKGDSVAALCLNHHRYLEIYFACHALGAIINPLNIRLKEDEIGYILKDSESKILFIDKPFVPMKEKVCAAAECVKEVYYSDGDEAPAGIPSMSELVDGQSKKFKPANVKETEVAAYCYTGGTTGLPKGVMLTVRNIMSNAFHLQSMMQYTEKDVYLHIAPMFHLADAASYYAITMMGGTHVFGRAFEPKLTLELIQKHKVTALLLVPTMITFVINHPDFDKYDLSSMRLYVYGASPMPVPLLKKAMEKFPCMPAQGYGMTEAAPLVTTLTQDDHKLGATDPKWAWVLGSAGRPVPGVDVKIVDAKGKEVKIGEAGEIIIRGPNIMKGYLKKEQATQEAIRKGWYYSGDVAIRNELGFLTIVDRMKDMIISGGENIYTTEVENVVLQVPGILEATVIGIPHPTWGEAVKAFVVMKPGETSSELEIIEFCRQRLAHYKCPSSVEFLPELPKSGAGKILKRDLRERYWGKGRQVN